MCVCVLNDKPEIRARDTDIYARAEEMEAEDGLTRGPWSQVQWIRMSEVGIH